MLYTVVVAGEGRLWGQGVAIAASTGQHDSGDSRLLRLIEGRAKIGADTT